MMMYIVSNVEKHWPAAISWWLF